MEETYYTITIAGVQRDLRLFEVKPGVRIAILNILGDTELVEAASRDLAKKLHEHRPEVLLTAETKSIPLAHDLSSVMGIPYVVLRKNYKPYMGDALQAETLSITTGAAQTLYLDEKDRSLLEGNRVAIIDDVISTGSTLQAMRLVLNKVGGVIVAEGAILTEGDRAQWMNIISLGHLPVWIEGKPHD
ncbi:MAG: adenine phosphoribosyltransferase [Anaerolineae bacterium]|jgi:adenine phosphoribosyltransferase|nr:adenine phosphoribosyltransferase [Anaerolineae bacterium]